MERHCSSCSEPLEFDTSLPLQEAESQAWSESGLQPLSIGHHLHLWENQPNKNLHIMQKLKLRQPNKRSEKTPDIF